MILCSEKCLHENDGLCNLKEVTRASSTPTDDCPYFKDKSKKENVIINHEIYPPVH